jgi:hypothetical protein
MPNRSSKPKRPRDPNQLAKLITDIATGEATDDAGTLSGKKADSRKGGLRGGKTRMAGLTEEERTELAKRAAAARWKKAAPSEQNGAADTESVKKN